MHVLDHLIGTFIHYFTVILLFPLLDTRHLETSLGVVRFLFRPLHITLDIINCDKPVSSIPKRSRQPTQENPVLITVFQHQCTTFVIDANHTCVDGTLIYNLLHLWSMAYIGTSYIIEPKIDFVGNYPLSRKLVSKVKLTHPFSDYIISTTLWSHYISAKTNIRTFGHVVSFRGVNETYVAGNFCTVVSVELGKTLYESCYILKKATEYDKDKRNQTTAIIPIIKNYVTCRVIYSSWLNYKHLKFGSSTCKSFYFDSYENHKITAAKRINLVCMHNNSYYLSHSIDGCNNDSFKGYVRDT